MPKIRLSSTHSAHNKSPNYCKRKDIKTSALMTQEAADTMYALYIKKVVKQVDYYNQSKKDLLLDPDSEGICFALDFVDMECLVLSDILRGLWSDALNKIAEWECDDGLRDNYVEVFDKIVEDSQDGNHPNLQFKVQGERRDDFEVRTDIPDLAYKNLYEGLAQTNKLIKCLRCLCLIGFAKEIKGQDLDINDGDVIQFEAYNGWQIKWEVDYANMEYSW